MHYGPVPGVQFIVVADKWRMKKQGGGGEENGEGMPIITGQDSIRITFSC